MLDRQRTPTDAAGYREMAQRYLERPPTPQLANLAISFYQKAIALAPDDLESYFDLAYAYRELGEADQAVACCEEALARVPASLAARFCHCMMQLAMIYRTQSEVEAARTAYTTQLHELTELVSRASVAQLQDVVAVMGKISPSYMLYQGQDDLALMQCYGRLLTQVMAACYPRWSRPLPVIPPAARQPIRVGMVSAVFYQQSIWEDLIRGWISQLDPQRFTLLGYHVGKTQDEATAYTRTCFTNTVGGKFIEGQRSLEEWAQLIRADQPHVLLYPDVNRRKRSTQLAALRLAPRQCTTWVNLVTSGLPTMDYILSGELLEPPDAAAHYSEKLVCLPRTGFYYTPLPFKPDEGLTRADFGLRPGAVVYFCGQTLFKYMPQYDNIYPQIAQALDRQGVDCQFVFLKGPLTEPLCKRFDQRLVTAFAELGLDKVHHVVLLPRLNASAYQRINQLSDLFLDSIGTGGSNTTLESLPYDLPVITWPGPFSRGRVSAGIFRQMGITSTIADSLEEYLALAIRLGEDVVARQAIRQQIAAQKERFYADPAPIAGLTTFLEDMAYGR